jgi:hypothetical protein
VASNGRKKAKTSAGLPSNTKTPKRLEDLSVGEEIDLPSSFPCWNFSQMDRAYSGGSWDWELSHDEHIQLLDFLATIEKSTWKQIWNQKTGNKQSHNKHHMQDTETLSKEARERLSDIHLGEMSRLFRFRLSGTVRLWGYFRGKQHQFYLLWWDRNHQVYPTEKS